MDFDLLKLNEYKELSSHADRMKLEKNHLRHLIDQPGRFDSFRLHTPGLNFDYSKQRLDLPVCETLFKLAHQTRVLDRFNSMCKGDVVNVTEGRAAWHTSTRDGSNADVMKVNRDIQAFVRALDGKEIVSGTGRAFTDVVVVGIGGSYLGCQFAYQAMKAGCRMNRKLHFLSNVDIDNFNGIVRAVCPDTTLWIIVSKSYTTTETLANLNQVLEFLHAESLDPARHIVTITAEGSPGESGTGDVLKSFHMFDYIGGRYSVTSAVGGVPLSLCFGYEVFEKFLKGCHAMDQHACDTPPEKNIPLTSALISLWNIHFLDYRAQAVIPYSSALSSLSAHVQQLYMESLGKQADLSGRLVQYPTGSIIFGEPGTNAQHSFFQLAHQGMPFPIEFIGAVRPAYNNPGVLSTGILSKGVTNHQELWANMIAQARALATGRDNDNVHRFFPGNRPSSTLVINDLSPESIGMLLSYYEARTVFEGFLLNINPFDQFGVELGKKTADGIRSLMAAKNMDEKALADETADPSTRFYIDTLFKGELQSKR